MGFLERFIAFRYISDRGGRREGRGFVRFVTIVGIAGVAVGVAALILALSIVHGFSNEIGRKILGFGADIQIESQVDRPLENVTTIASSVAAFDAVATVRPVIQEFALLRRSPKHVDGVLINGTAVLPRFLVENLEEGASDYASKNGDGVVIGRGLADRSRISVGDTVVVFSFRSPTSEAGVSLRPRVKSLVVNGIYRTSLADFDDTFVYCDIDVARRLFLYGPEEASRLDVDLKPAAAVDEVLVMMDGRFDFPIMVRSIREVYRSLFAWVKLQESIIPVVIGFIVLVALFNIGGILLMLVIEKAKSLGVLSSLGAGRRSVRNVVVTLGGMIGVFGVVVGELLAFTLALLQKKFEIIPLPPEAYYMSTAPIDLNIVDFVGVGIATVLLCIVFAYIPARVASQLDPIRVIRFQ